MSTNLGVKKIKRYLTTQRTVGTLEPDAGFVDGPKDLDSLRYRFGHSVEPVRFLRAMVRSGMPNTAIWH